MSRKNLAFACFLLALFVPLIFGILNYVSAKPLPWVLAALGEPWDQLPAQIQAVLLSYMKLTGSGLIGVALAAAFILFIPFRRGEVWALWAIGTVATIAPLLGFYGLLSMELETGAAQPWYNPLISMALVAIGLLIMLSRSREASLSE